MPMHFKSMRKMKYPVGAIASSYLNWSKYIFKKLKYTIGTYDRKTWRLNVFLLLWELCLVTMTVQHFRLPVTKAFCLSQKEFFLDWGNPNYFFTSKVCFHPQGPSANKIIYRFRKDFSFRKALTFHLITAD